MCSPSLVRLEGEQSLQRVCNPCVLNVQIGPILRDRLDNLSDQLNTIANLRSPMDGTSDNLEDAVRTCESTLPGLEHQIDTYRNSELHEVKTKCAAAETCAADLTSKLQRALTEQGRLEQLVAELQAQIAHTEIAAEVRVKKFQTKEARERLQRQGLATDLRELREAHRGTAPACGIPPEPCKLSTEVASSSQQVVEELQDVQVQCDDAEPQTAKSTAPADVVYRSAAEVPVVLTTGFAWPFVQPFFNTRLVDLSGAVTS